MITTRSDMTVEKVDFMGGDETIIRAMMVSTKGAEALEEEATYGRIAFLMKNRHGCYDSQTDVLTRDGWKNWTDVNGTEEFLTLNMQTDEMEYQHATRLVRRKSEGPMIKISMAQVDALVTPDHKMVSAPRTSTKPVYGLHAAKDMLHRCYRLKLNGGVWDGEIHDPEQAALIGFIAADGNVGPSCIEFHMNKQHKIDWLYGNHPTIGVTNNRYRILNTSSQLKLWAKQTYTESNDRCFPRELLERGDVETLTALFDGYLQGDGSISPTGKISCSTVSRQMVDDLQELALKVGYAAVEVGSDFKRDGAFGSRPLYKLTIYQQRNNNPRVGLTREARSHQVQLVNYEGDVHCVTVPNGTLYVRRNGKPMWCGNTPFEHNSLMFYVEAPIFVFREFHRHRIGFSYNEMSGRYKELPPMFYVPDQERKLIQVGKPGHYEFKAGSLEQWSKTCSKLHFAYEKSYYTYQSLLKDGVAKEVARACLPVAIYSAMFVTCNARSLMSFLSLRTKRDGSTFPSYPQREIEVVAEKLEYHLKMQFPLTYQAFNEHGRVAP